MFIEKCSDTTVLKYNLYRISKCLSSSLRFTFVYIVSRFLHFFWNVLTFFRSNSLQCWGPKCKVSKIYKINIWKQHINHKHKRIWKQHEEITFFFSCFNWSHSSRAPVSPFMPTELQELGFRPTKTASIQQLIVSQTKNSCTLSSAA